MVEFDSKIFKSEMFDYVTLSQVLEHVTDPLHTLNEIATVLKPGGMVIISMPNASGWGARVFGRKWINWHVPYHLQFFSNASMLVAAKQAGLELVKSRTVTSSNWLIHQIIHLLEYPEQGTPSAYWSKQREKTSIGRKLMRRAVSSTRLLLIPQLLTRIMDIAQLGDNRIIILRKRDPV